MTISKRIIAATFIIVCLLASLIIAPTAHSAVTPTPFSIVEKDLFHYYAASPNPATPCVTFTATDLPKASNFDTATGLFTWLPDYGSAGSYTVTFGCADDPANPGTQQIKLDIAAATPFYIQSSTPKVTLVAAKIPANTSQDNDQKSLITMLGVYGLKVEVIEDLAAALTAKTVGEILVVPSYMASGLSNATIQQVVTYVKGGGLILLFGKSPLSEALGISYTGGARTVTQFVDYLNPKLFLTWADGEVVDAFSANASDSLLTVDKQTLNPLVVGRQYDKGRILYVGTNYYDHFSIYGTKGHPYLLYHFMDVFHLKSRVSAASIDAYFDPGNYDLSKVYIEDIVRTWADRGITTVYAAAWHFWINEQTRVEWTFGYQHFIDVCHLWGIKVYPWLALPHVSQKFWFTKPECREQTAGTGEKYIFWRLNVNLQNPACLTSALQFVDDVLNTYDWDGVNLAEIYYDHEAAMEYFTPMNKDLRNNYAAISGFDPIAFFDSTSPHYYQTDTASWTQFLQYRTNLVTSLHKTFMDRIFQNPKSGDWEVMLTAVDNLHKNYPDLNFPPGFTGSFDLGVDLQAILQLLDTKEYMLQVEDAWPFWSSNPFRYLDFKKTYLAQFPHFKVDDTSLMFDVNVVKNAHNPSGGPTPLYNFSAEKQTGLEFALLLKNMFSDNLRLALFSENSAEVVDIDRLKWALAGDTILNQLDAATVSFTTKRTTKLEANPPFYSVHLDGKKWPAWSTADNSVLLPVGSHQLTFHTDDVYNDIKLSGISCVLEDSGVIPGGISVSYNSPRQKAVLTIEAFAKKDSEPFRILVDGSVYNATIYTFYGDYRLFLPKGKHSVQIYVMHELSADNTLLSGANNISLNAPLALTFTDPINPATLTASTFIVKDANNTVIPGKISYDAAGMTANFMSDVPLAPGAAYSITVTAGVTDIYGRTMAAAKSLTFTTESFGDINNNKKIDIAAALKYLHVALGLEAQPNLPAAQIIIAPINRVTGKPAPQAGRTKINIQDALAALERVVGLW
jgi:hypothetical protein